LSSNVATGPADPTTTTASISRSGFFIYTIRIIVTTRDALGNLLGKGGDQVQVQEGTLVRPTHDEGDGTYTDTFATIDPTLAIAITLNGVPLAGSPFHPQ
jgi:hypothetical protein